MKGALLAAAALGASVAAFTVATREPEDQLSVLTLVVALAVSAGALAARLLLAFGHDRRGRALATARATALRRGAEVGACVGILAALRVSDGLTPLTGAFVVIAFAVAEYVASARAG